jgi:PglZ domain
MAWKRWRPLVGKVSDEILRMIEKQVADHGIVVWYDGERAYEKLAREMALPKAKFLTYESSFFALREKLEPFLEWIDANGKPRPDGHVPRKLLIYLPIEQEKTQYALIEAETAGVVMKPGANPWQRNTKLKAIAERVFREITPDRAEEIGRQVEQGVYSLEDLDRLAEQAAEITAGGIKLIFGTASPSEVALAFLASDRHDADIEAKQAMPQLADLLCTGLGIEVKPDGSVATARAAVRRGLLVGDFLASLDPEKRPRELASIVTGEKAQLELCQKVCRDWRNRSDLRESYVKVARQTERDIRTAVLETDAEALTTAVTFPCIEEKLLGHAESLILAGDWKRAGDMVERRRGSFWSGEEWLYGLHWSILEAPCQMSASVLGIRNGLKAAKGEPGALLRAYATGTEPWCLLDTHYRHMERRYAQLSAETTADKGGLEKVIRQSRQAYSDAVSELAEAWTSALMAAGFTLDNFAQQDRVYSDRVAPALREGRRTAYFLVDALRYEMGRELGQSLEEEFDANVFPVLAQPPTVTEVGMAALLPDAEKGMELAEKGGKLAVRLGGQVLQDRAARLEYFENHTDAKMMTMKLGETSRPTTKRKIEDHQPELLLVTSQEIDKLGEMGEEEDETRKYMDDVMTKLSQAVRRLTDLGFELFVIASDHGHLYGENIESGMKMDPPGGKTVQLRRRVWIGQGGASGAGFVRLLASDLALGGEMELAFPRGLGLFRAKGGSEAYFHGGLSLQEMVIPVITLRRRAPRRVATSAARVKLEMEREKITTRFFSITLTYAAEGLFEAAEMAIRLRVTSGKKEVGAAVMAAYGFNEASREVRLAEDKPNHVTVRLSEEGIKHVSVAVYDAASQVEVARLDNIAVDIAF